MGEEGGRGGRAAAATLRAAYAALRHLSPKNDGYIIVQGTLSSQVDGKKSKITSKNYGSYRQSGQEELSHLGKRPAPRN